MHGVVLAAGEGTRLRPLTATQPKGLVAVDGVPLLTHCFETLVSLGVDSLVVVVGYRGADIRACYGEDFRGVPIVYAEQAERDGLASALLTAEPHVTGSFLAMNGDNVCSANLDAVVETHRERDADATLLVEDVSRAAASRTGVLDFEGEELVGVVEKPDDPPSTTVPRGFFAFSPAIFDACRAIDPSPTGEYELTAAVDRLLRRGSTVETVPLDGWCVNVNTPDDVERAGRLLAGE